MMREILITLYLTVFKVLFNIFKMFPLKNKVTFTVSFGDNSKYVYDEIRRKDIDVEVAVLYKGAAGSHFQECRDIDLIPFESGNLASFLKSIYHLATSKYIIIDNYFGFLAVTDFKEGTECIQLWHASGALKKFGLEDQSVKYRSKRAQERFLRVYDKFDKVIVGSDMMANIFMNAFNLPQERILRTGIPRTDFFYDESTQNQIIDTLIKENPVLKYKKKVLYAPTYRDNQLDEFKMELELDEMSRELGEDYVVLLRLHPAIKGTVDYSELYPGFVYNYSSSKYDINELLLIANYLITDYSSIPYEFSLLNKPMIFFAYDLEQYKKERGLMDNYEHTVPGPVVNHTKDIIALIKEDNFNLEEIKEYAVKWNRYSAGDSSENLVRYLFEKEAVISEGQRRTAL
ncbi:CDP-glycerol glycerophosphotransferase family protein [Mesobacillus foraminis]|uniref:CDP-glycerol glycerophosphotransferase family protein n=1 Tax=Mesobacillus foraminis TaxID=279826 RepID=UPI001BE6D9CF|nr:CDP-glycerol glycerophosphotransferase family protein [Mesobacillus foraminis]MBT2757221.1 CDP-glycerol glycerophosphotransferase family protein [Mesobacillus foraminis]